MGTLANNDKLVVVDVSDNATKQVDISQVTSLIEGFVAPTGTAGQIQTSNGASGFGTAITPPDGDLVGTTDEQTLSAKTLASPQITGTPEYATALGSIFPVVGTAQTSSTTPEIIASYAMADETMCAFDAIVTSARRTNVTKAGRWKLSVVYRRTGGGAPTIVGSLEAPPGQETEANTVTIDVSSNTVRVLGTAADSDPRNWMCELRVQKMLAT
jgi:hypothetical protein